MKTTSTSEWQPLQPQLVTIHEIKVMGIKALTGRNQKSNVKIIEALWRDFNPRSHQISQRIDHGDWAKYGLSFDSEARGYSYLAGVEVAHFEHLPPGMETRTIPGGQYAFFEHHGDMGAIWQTISRIFREWLPLSGFSLIDNHPINLFEKYDKRFRWKQPESIVSLYIPIQLIP